MKTPCVICGVPEKRGAPHSPAECALNLRAEVESLRERLDKEEEERRRQYGMRVQAEERAAFLLELLRATVRTGTKDPLLDARLAEEIRSHG